LRVALVPSSRAVLLYKALLTPGDPDKSKRSDDDVTLLAPGESAGTLVPLVLTRDGFRDTVGSFEDPIPQSSAGLDQVQQALLTGLADCGVLPAARVIEMADASDGRSQGMVLVAQLGSAGGPTSDLGVVVRKGVSATQAPPATRTAATAGFDAQLTLLAIVGEPYKVLGDLEIQEALASGSIDLVVGPRDRLQPALDAGSAEPFRPLTDDEARPSAQVIACRVSTLGNEEARASLLAMLRTYRGYIERRGAQDPTALAARYPRNARVDIEALEGTLAALKSQELTQNAALQIIDLQAMEESRTVPEGPLGASAILVDNRLVATSSGAPAAGPKPGGENDLELPPAPE
jgi:hypothetical protein